MIQSGSHERQPITDTPVLRVPSFVDGVTTEAEYKTRLEAAAAAADITIHWDIDSANIAVIAKWDGDDPKIRSVVPPPPSDVPAPGEVIHIAVVTISVGLERDSRRS